MKHDEFAAYMKATGDKPVTSCCGDPVDLSKAKVLEASEVLDAEEDDLMDTPEQDLVEAADLLSELRHFLHYLSDKKLCSTIQREDRKEMTGYAESITEFLEGIEYDKWPGAKAPESIHVEEVFLEDLNVEQLNRVIGRMNLS